MADTTETLKKLVESLKKSIKTKADAKEKLQVLFERESDSREINFNEMKRMKAEAVKEGGSVKESGKFSSGESTVLRQLVKAITEHDKKIDVLQKKLHQLSQEISPLEFKLKLAETDLKMYVAEKGKLDKKDKDYEKKKKELQKKIKSKI